MPYPALYSGPVGRFPEGYTSITHADAIDGSAWSFGIRKLPSGATLQVTAGRECAFVLMQGEASVSFDGKSTSLRRKDVFSDPPFALHLGPKSMAEITAGAEGAEFAEVHAPNSVDFAARLFSPEDSKPEYRGTGLVRNAALRNVRLIFDQKLRPESNLVIGEVVNYPGRWSSYPPHHHDQPEIYHYRFTDPAGYGHAEVGNDVLKVRTGDTILIPPGCDHAQVAAPGYGMYYLWIIRHLPGNPYTGFTFAPEHTWTLNPEQQGWSPSELPPGLS